MEFRTIFILICLILANYFAQGADAIYWLWALPVTLGVSLLGFPDIPALKGLFKYPLLFTALVILILHSILYLPPVLPNLTHFLNFLLIALVGLFYWQLHDETELGKKISLALFFTLMIEGLFTVWLMERSGAILFQAGAVFSILFLRHEKNRKFLYAPPLILLSLFLTFPAVQSNWYESISLFSIVFAIFLIEEKRPHAFCFMMIVLLALSPFHIFLAAGLIFFASQSFKTVSKTSLLFTILSPVFVLYLLAFHPILTSAPSFLQFLNTLVPGKEQLSQVWNYTPLDEGLIPGFSLHSWLRLTLGVDWGFSLSLGLCIVLLIWSLSRSSTPASILHKIAGIYIAFFAFSPGVSISTYALVVCILTLSLAYDSEKQNTPSRLLFVFFVTRCVMYFPIPHHLITDLPYFHQIAENLANGKWPYTDFNFEYPPLALIPIYLPLFLSQWITTSSVSSYIHLHRLEYLILDTVFFLWLKRLSKNKEIDDFGLYFYIFSGFILGEFAYDRMDLLVGMGLAFALQAMLRGRFRLSQISQVLVCFFKFIPLVTLPIFMLNALAKPVKNKWTYLTDFGLFWLSAIGITGLIFDRSVLNFIVYQHQRGIQIESTWVSLYYLLNSVLPTSLPAMQVNRCLQGEGASLQLAGSDLSS